MECKGDCIGYCGLNGMFQGKYENEKLEITYKVSDSIVKRPPPT